MTFGLVLLSLMLLLMDSLPTLRRVVPILVMPVTETALPRMIATALPLIVWKKILNTVKLERLSTFIRLEMIKKKPTKTFSSSLSASLPSFSSVLSLLLACFATTNLRRLKSSASSFLTSRTKPVETTKPCHRLIAHRSFLKKLAWFPTLMSKHLNTSLTLGNLTESRASTTLRTFTVLMNNPLKVWLTQNRHLPRSTWIK
mmetsp:Transcript_58615/g.80449  ORF Transcript_58615/g.80449 Transcript_58615/m.80449 type:complete len:201 (+) Transcript_58615:1887-2489(+)